METTRAAKRNVKACLKVFKIKDFADYGDGAYGEE
jgi:hypothetical protein